MGCVMEMLSSQESCPEEKREPEAKEELSPTSVLQAVRLHGGLTPAELRSAEKAGLHPSGLQAPSGSPVPVTRLNKKIGLPQFQLDGSKFLRKVVGKGKKAGAGVESVGLKGAVLLGAAPKMKATKQQKKEKVIKRAVKVQAELSVQAEPLEVKENLVVEEVAEVVAPEMEAVQEVVAWPTRKTFAGRSRPTSTWGGQIWDKKRRAFYQSFPPEEWKDMNERKFWNIYTPELSEEQAVEEYLRRK